MNKILAIFGLVLVKRKTINETVEYLDLLVEYDKKGWGINSFDVEGLKHRSIKIKEEIYE